MVLNLSKPFPPSTAQIRLLERGLTFVPQPTKFDWEELQRDLHQYHRRLKIISHIHFRPNTQSIQFSSPSSSEPELSQLDGDLQALIYTDIQALCSYRPPRDFPDNLSMAECRALKQLVQNPNIIIKPADKGSKIIILDRQQYLLEANGQLNN